MAISENKHPGCSEAAVSRYALNIYYEIEVAAWGRLAMHASEKKKINISFSFFFFWQDKGSPAGTHIEGNTKERMTTIYRADIVGQWARTHGNESGRGPGSDGVEKRYFRLRRSGALLRYTCAHAIP